MDISRDIFVWRFRYDNCTYVTHVYATILLCYNCYASRLTTAFCPFPSELRESLEWAFPYVLCHSHVEFSTHFPPPIHTISFFILGGCSIYETTKGFFFRMFWTRYTSPSLIFLIDKINCISTNLRIWFILMKTHCYQIVESGSQRRTCCRRKFSPVHFRHWKCFVSEFFEVFSWGGVGGGGGGGYFYDRSVSLQILTWHRGGAKPLSERMAVPTNQL